MSLDAALFRVMNGLSDTPLSNAFWGFLTDIGRAGAVWVVLALVLLLGAGRLPGLRGPNHARWRAVGMALLVALALSWGVESSLKALFARPRPPFALQGVHVIGAIPPSYSFPSGHAVSSFAAASLLLAAAGHNRADAWLAVVLAGLISVSRIITGHHYPVDVLAGVILGVLVGRLTWRMLGALLTPRTRPTAR